MVSNSTAGADQAIEKAVSYGIWISKNTRAACFSGSASSFSMYRLAGYFNYQFSMRAFHIGRQLLSFDHS